LKLPSRYITASDIYERLPVMVQELVAAILLGPGFSFCVRITCRTANIRNVLNLEKKTAKLLIPASGCGCYRARTPAIMS